MEVKKAIPTDLARNLGRSSAPNAGAAPVSGREGLDKSSSSQGAGVLQGNNFADTLSKLQSPEFKKPVLGAGGVVGNGIAGSAAAHSAAAVKFSNHAVERMRTRGISFSPEDLGRLNEAVGRAAAKGSRDSLILMNDSALIVNVKSGTVVTVMDKNALKENVFTNIDSTIVM